MNSEASLPRLAHGEFFGETVRSRTVAGLACHESRYAPGAVLPEHTHEVACYCLVVRGAYEERCGTRRHSCEPATLTFHPRGEAHADRFHPGGGHLFSVALAPRWAERLRGAGVRLDRRLPCRGGRLSHLAMRLLAEFRSDDTASALAMEGLVLELVAATQRREPRSDRGAGRVERARDYLHAHCSEPVSLGSVAAAIGAHPVTLARGFRRRYGCTLGDYLRRLRI